MHKRGLQIVYRCSSLLRILIVLFVLSCGKTVYAQVTVGSLKSAEPFSLLEVSTDNRVGGLRLPQLSTAQRDALTTAAFKADAKALGLMIYNTDTRCIDSWNGTAWISKCDGDPLITSLACSSAVLSPYNPTANQPYSGVVKIPYGSGNGAFYPAGRGAISKGVAGLTATLRSGVLANSQGDSLVFDISGTPDDTEQATSASFKLIFGSDTCNYNLPVIHVSTLDCSSGTFSPATAEAGVVYDGTFTINYTGGSGAAYTAQKVYSTGVTGLTAELTAGSLATGAGTLSYTVKGTPVYDGSTGSASFSVSIGGKTCTVLLPVIGITVLDCERYTKVGGTLIKNTTYTGSSYSITLPYSRGSGAEYGVRTVSSTGVTGLTATLSAGKLNALDDGTLTYVITGTPVYDGSNYAASFTFTFGGQSCTIDLPVDAVKELKCGSATFSGVPVRATYFSGTFSLPYTKASGLQYKLLPVASTGITGLTATIVNGNTTAGADGTLVFTVTGTPVYDGTSGTANFLISFGGEQCTVQMPVLAVMSLNGAVLGNNNTVFKVSPIFDKGSKISTTIQIPYTKGSGAPYPAQYLTYKSGPNGCTALVRASTLASLKDGYITVDITGEPDAAGRISLLFTFSGIKISMDVYVTNCSAGVYFPYGDYVLKTDTYLGVSDPTRPVYVPHTWLNPTSLSQFNAYYAYFYATGKSTCAMYGPSGSLSGLYAVGQCKDICNHFSGWRMFNLMDALNFQMVMGRGLLAFMRDKNYNGNALDSYFGTNSSYFNAKILQNKYIPEASYDVYFFDSNSSSNYNGISTTTYMDSKINYQVYTYVYRNGLNDANSYYVVGIMGHQATEKTPCRCVEPYSEAW